MNCFTNRYHCCFIAWPIHFKTVYLFEEELLRNNVNELISSSPFLYNFSQFQFKTTSLHVIYLTTNIAFSLPLFLFPLCKADFLFLFTTKAHFFSTLRYFPSLSSLNHKSIVIVYLRRQFAAKCRDLQEQANKHCDLVRPLYQHKEPN